MDTDQLRRLLGERVADHALHPRHLGPLSHPDGRGVRASACGHDVIEIHVRLRAGVVADVGLTVRGCAHTIAAASAATELLEDRDLGAALGALDAAAISRRLGTLPPDKLHCAELAADAARAALQDAVRTSREPWRRAYRR